MQKYPKTKKLEVLKKVGKNLDFPRVFVTTGRGSFKISDGKTPKTKNPRQQSRNFNKKNEKYIQSSNMSKIG